MYTVTIEKIKKGQKKGEILTFELGEMDSPEYNKTMKALSDILFDFDMDFDDVAGEGDIMIDDVMIAISEEEAFEEVLEGKKEKYIVKGFVA